MTERLLVIKEGTAEVPGALLRYRLLGEPGHGPTIVLENGWATPYDYFTPFAVELGRRAQVLLYNRAGIGGSVAREPLTAESYSRNLISLLDSLQILDPVVVAGQSYGGLICGVHASLIPERLRASVQIDPTVDQADKHFDRAFVAMRYVGRLLQFMAALGIPEPFLSNQSMGELSDEDAERIRRYAFRSASSMRSAVAELNLISAFRAICMRPSRIPQLIISADRAAELSGIAGKLVPPDRARDYVAQMQSHHQITAERGGSSNRWVKLPYDHGTLVMTREGAAETAREIFAFVEQDDSRGARSDKFVSP